MKKFLLSLFTIMFALPVMAVEIYNNGDESVNFYGSIRGYVGYGLDMNNPNHGQSTSSSSMLYALQGNSRIGTDIKISNFTSKIELGFDEATFFGGTKSLGIRHAWGAYSFGNNGKLLMGKTDTPTAMSGFSSDIYDGDGGLKGFGGTVTGQRRFQIQYTVVGLTLALVEDDVAELGSKYTNFTEGGKYTPRASLAYVYKNDSLHAKIGATYTAVNGYYTDINNQWKWTNLHAFGIVAGIKQKFLDEKFYFSLQARYGMNEELYGEYTTRYMVAENNKTNEIGVNASINNDGSFNNVHRVGATLEFGVKATENFTAVLGGGYQNTLKENTANENYESYAVFLQGAYKLNKYFSIIPQITYYNTTGSNTSQSALIAAAQLKASF